MHRIYFFLVFAGALLGAMMSAQQPQPSLTLTAAEKAGRSIFQTRCAMCHVGGESTAELTTSSERRPSTMGPLLGRNNTTNEAALRQKIKDGSARMPGYKYTLSGEQVDQVVAFMKTIDKPLTRLFAAPAGASTVQNAVEGLAVEGLLTGAINSSRGAPLEGVAV